MHTISPVKTARIRKGLTQSQLAEQLGVSKATVSGWELGAANPGADRLAALSRALRPHLNLADYLRHIEASSSERVA